MDYRGRRYYLVQAPYRYMDDIVALLKGTFKYSKVHFLENNKNDPSWSSKIMISCNYNEHEILENLLSNLQQKFVSRTRFEVRRYYGNLKVSLQFVELTKDVLGQ